MTYIYTKSFHWHIKESWSQTLRKTKRRDYMAHTRQRFKPINMMVLIDQLWNTIKNVQRQKWCWHSRSQFMAEMMPSLVTSLLWWKRGYLQGWKTSWKWFGSRRGVNGIWSGDVRCVESQYESRSMRSKQKGRNRVIKAMFVNFKALWSITVVQIRYVSYWACKISNKPIKLIKLMSYLSNLW